MTHDENSATDNTSNKPLMPIWETVVGGHWDIVKEWLERDPSLINVTDNVRIRSSGYKKTTLLHVASALNSDVEILKYLVAQGANVNAVAKRGQVHLVHNFDTTAKFDVDAYDEGVLQDIISRGADVNEMAMRGWMIPLCLAASFNPCMEILQYLFSVSAKVHPKILLRLAAPSNSNVAILEYFVSQGAEVNMWVLGDAASDNPNVAILEYIVSHRIDVSASFNANGLFWTTPLHCAAASNSNVDVLKSLIAKGADADADAIWDNGSFHKPLHAAASSNSNVEVLKYLIAHGADVHAKNDKGEKPLDVANSEEKKHILREAMKKR